MTKHKSAILLLDFDLVLFDTVKLREEVSKTLQSMGFSVEQIADLWMLEKTMRHLEHHVIESIKAFCEKYDCVEKRELVFQALVDQDFEQMVFDDVKIFTNKMRETYQLIIFSQGDSVFQNVKIAQSGLIHLVDHIAVYQDKIKWLKTLLEEYPRQGKRVYYFDDKVDMLHKANQVDSSIITVHVVRYPFRRQEDSEYQPDYQIENLLEFSQIPNNSL